MISCIYCEETNEYKLLIPKPASFVANNMKHLLLDGGKFICLECLEEEMEALKEVY